MLTLIRICRMRASSAPSPSCSATLPPANLRSQETCFGFPGTLLDHRDEIIQFAAREKLPVVHGRREYVIAGGVMSFDVDRAYGLSRAAVLFKRYSMEPSPLILRLSILHSIRQAMSDGVAPRCSSTTRAIRRSPTDKLTFVNFADRPQPVLRQRQTNFTHSSVLDGPAQPPTGLCCDRIRPQPCSPLLA